VHPCQRTLLLPIRPRRLVATQEDGLVVAADRHESTIGRDRAKKRVGRATTATSTATGAATTATATVGVRQRRVRQREVLRRVGERRHRIGATRRRPKRTL